MTWLDPPIDVIAAITFSLAAPDYLSREHPYHKYAGWVFAAAALAFWVRVGFDVAWLAGHDVVPASARISTAYRGIFALAGLLLVWKAKILRWPW